MEVGCVREMVTRSKSEMEIRSIFHGTDRVFGSGGSLITCGRVGLSRFGGSGGRARRGRGGGGVGLQIGVTGAVAGNARHALRRLG